METLTTVMAGGGTIFLYGASGHGDDALSIISSADKKPNLARLHIVFEYEQFGKPGAWQAFRGRWIGGGDKSALASTSETTGLSDALLTDLRAARTGGLRLELADRPHIALRAVAHSLAAHLIG